MKPEEVNNAFGNIDLYLLDQLLKGNFKDRHKILDAGCGEGRNLKHFVTEGYEVYGVDNYPSAIQMAQMIYKDKCEFKIESIENQPFEGNFFDAILCINVLHHCTGKDEFMRICNAMAAMLKPKGLLFIRTLIQHENETAGFYEVPQKDFSELIHSMNFRWIEPLKKEVMPDGKALGVIVLEKN